MHALSVVVSLLSSSHAAGGANLVTTITPPSVAVYEPGDYIVGVKNAGTRPAQSVELVIELPQTNTSPAVHVMGDVGVMSPGCSLSGTTVTCSLGLLRRGRTRKVRLELALPASADDLVVTASATSSSRHSSVADERLVDLDTVDVMWAPPRKMTVRHCTGTHLGSFFECELYPSSIMTHYATLEADGSITLGAPGYSGEWWSTAPDHLGFEYVDGNGTVVVEFDGVGVDDSCFEGRATFPSNPAYVAIYQVCDPTP